MAGPALRLWALSTCLAAHVAHAAAQPLAPETPVGTVRHFKVRPSAPAAAAPAPSLALSPPVASGPGAAPAAAAMRPRRARTEPVEDPSPGACIRHTGGSCVVNGCDAWRGNTTCDWGRCFCATGCSDINGQCHEERNVKVLESFTLRNMRYPDYYAYAPSMGRTMQVENSEPGEETQFDLYQLPGQEGAPEAFVMMSRAYPNYAVTVNRHSSDGGVEFNGHMRHLTRGRDSAVLDSAVKLVQAPDHPGALMITSYKSGTAGRYLYVAAGGWDIGAYEDDPGTGGYWIPDPVLPNIRLRQYNGRRCSYDCGHALRRSGGAAAVLTALLAALLGLAMGA